MQTETEESRIQESTGTESSNRSIVRLKRTVRIREEEGAKIDEKRISPQFYNNFDSSIMMKLKSFGKPIIGVTSANKSEGKTLVASNLAVTLSLARLSKVVLVDLNILKPDVHNIFGLPSSPGLLDAFSELAIDVYATPLKDLFVIPVGDVGRNSLAALQMGSAAVGTDQQDHNIAMDHLSTFRDITYSLAQEFDFVIVDLPPVEEASVTTLFTKQLDGVIVVVSAGKSKQGELNRLMNLLGQDLVLGFVFNRANMSELV